MKSVDVDLSIDIINDQLNDIRTRQKSGHDEGPKLTTEVMTMARGMAAFLAEQRKGAEEAEEAIDGLTSDRVAALTLRLIEKLSPEHRAAVALRIKQLGGRLIAHE